VRAEYGEDRFIDVQYRKLLPDPLGEFRRAMYGMGLEVTPADDLDCWIAATAATRTRARVPVEDYGITEAMLKDVSVLLRRFPALSESIGSARHRRDGSEHDGRGPSMTIQSLDHVNIRTPRIDETIAFYRDASA
jgi:hypothetical protein